MRRITAVMVSIACLVGCSDWMVQQRGRHRPELAPDGSPYFTAHDLLGRKIDALHPDTCPLPVEEMERLQANGYTVVNGFAREMDPPYGPSYPTWICIDFTGPGPMAGSLLVATTREDAIIATEVSFRPPHNATVESVFADLDEYFLAQCAGCEPLGEERLACVDCTSSARVELAIDRESAIEKVQVSYFMNQEGLGSARRTTTPVSGDYIGF